MIGCMRQYMSAFILWYWSCSRFLKSGLIRFFFHLEQYFSLTNSSRFIQIPPSERSLAVVRRLEEPPLCECGDRAVINPENTLEFMCPNKHKVSEKCICLNVYLYMCTCTNIFSYSVMDLRSVVSISDSTVLRINGQSH